MKVIGKVKYSKQVDDGELGGYLVLGNEYEVTDDSSEGLLIINLNADPPTFFAATPDHFELVEDTDGTLINYLT